MDRTEARAAVADVLREIAPEADLTTCDPTCALADHLDLDSMDVLDLLSGIAARTGVDTPDGALEAGWSLDDLVAVLTRGGTET